MQRHTVYVDVFFQHIASGAGNVSHNGAFPARQGIEQTRFTGVWTTGNDHLHTFAEQGTLFGLFANVVDVANNIGQILGDLAIRQKINFFVWKINGCFNVHTKVDDGFRQCVYVF